MDLRELEVDCPYCGENIPVMVDPVSGEESYTEDCSVCCRPMVLTVDVDDDGEPTVSAKREED